MLTSANVTANMAAGYYAADNYYSAGAVLAEPVWMGAFARELGLEGPLDTKNFEQMLRGFGPDGRPLISNPEYPHQAKRIVSDDTKREVIAGVHGLFDQAGVKSDETRRALERTLEKHLDKGELREKMIARISRRLGNAIEASASGRSGEETLGEARNAVRSLLEKVKAPSPRRAAVDLTLSAPKSVSIQALVFGDSRLVEAHREAVRSTMQYAEEQFAACRVGSRTERRSVTTGKYAIAQFEHDLSRERDPHLHTHSVIINMTPVEGKVRALHNDELYQHKRMLGTICQNELALRVRELGFDIERSRNGMFEIAGYSREQI